MGFGCCTPWVSPKTRSSITAWPVASTFCRSPSRLSNLAHKVKRSPRWNGRDRLRRDAVSRRGRLEAARKGKLIMRLPCSLAALCVLLLVCACAHAVARQQPPAAAGHVHYVEPRAARRRRRPARSRRACRTSAPTRSRSRRATAQAQRVHQPGPEPGLRVQPRRGGPRVPRSGAARSRIWRWPTGGRRSCSARTSTRRWSRTRSRRRYELVQKAVSLKARGYAARAGLIDALAQRYSGKADGSAAARRGVRGGDAEACTSGSRTTSTSRCSTSSR